MKRLKAFLTFSLALLLGVSAFAQNNIQIGTGTQSTSYPPYSVWNYGWYSAIYPQSAVGTAKTIDTIAIECINGPKSFTNQKIYMKHSSAAIFGSAAWEDPTNSGYTLVYSGSINYNGWTKIPLSTPFVYNGTDNLVIHFENRSGLSNYANFNSTLSTTNNNKSSGSDVSFPTGSGFLNPYPGSLPNIKLYYASAGLPATPGSYYPAANDTRILVDTLVHFSLGANTTSYDLYFSTDSLAVATMNVSARVVNNAAVGAPGMFSYDPPSFMNSKTKYYWIVVAKNGSNTSASSFLKFTTQEVISAFPYNQGFEDSTVFYPGWYGMFTEWTYTSSGTNAVWGYTGNNDPHSGLYCAYVAPYAATTQSSLVSPRIFLSSGMNLSFWWRNGGHTAKISGQDSTFVEISTDGGHSWITLGSLSPAASQSAYQMALFDLNSYAGNNVYLRWRYKMISYSATNYVFLDDILIAAGTGPSISVNTSNYTFNELYEGGHTTGEVILTNNGTANLVITGTTVSAPFSCSYTGTIAPGGSDTAQILCTAATAASYSQPLSFTVSGSYSGSNTVTLNTNVLTPLGTFFEGFDLSSNYPAHWNKIKSPSDASNDVSVVSTTDAYSAPSCLKLLNANDSISPLLAICPGVTNFDVNVLTFYAKTGGTYTQHLVIGVMDDPYDASSFVADTTLVINGTYALYTVTLNPSNTKPYIAFKHSNDNDWTSFRIDDVNWNDNTPTVPACAEALYPANAANNVDVMMDVVLRWAGNGGAPTGYKVYFGNTSNPSTLIKDTAGTGVKVLQTLNYSTTYYWKVIAYNATGDATSCSVWSFQTMADPTVLTDYCENFDSDPDSLIVPLGWSFENLPSQAGQTYLGLCWDMITSSPSPAHSAPNAMASGPEFYEKNNWLFTPPITLQGTTLYQVGFYFKAQKLFSTDLERMRVLICSDNKASSVLDTLWDNDSIANETYELATVPFSVNTSGNYYIAFQAYSPYVMGGLENNVLLIDDICVDASNGIAENPTAFTIYPNPSHGSFTISTQNDNSDAAEIEVLNMLGQQLFKQKLQNNAQRIDLSSYGKGMYLLRIMSRGEGKTYKVVVE